MNTKRQVKCILVTQESFKSVLKTNIMYHIILATQVREKDSCFNYECFERKSKTIQNIMIYSIWNSYL